MTLADGGHRYCATCRGRRAGAHPKYEGPCLCGCERPARTRSGLALRCYNRIIHRRGKIQRALEYALGEAQPMDGLANALALGPPSDELRAYLVRFFQALHNGRLSLYPIRPQRRRPPENRLTANQLLVHK